MKCPLFILTFCLSIVALSASAAFDSAAWMEKRRLLTIEAERLRKAYKDCVAHLQVPAEDVTIPLETHPDGSVKTIIYAKRAQYFLNEGFIWAKDVIVRKFKKNGSLDVRIDAKACVIDRWSKSGWSEGPAKIVQGETTFKGSQVYFSSPEGYIKVYKDSDLDTKNLKAGGLKP